MGFLMKRMRLKLSFENNLWKTGSNLSRRMPPILSLSLNVLSIQKMNTLATTEGSTPTFQSLVEILQHKAVDQEGERSLLKPSKPVVQKQGNNTRRWKLQVHFSLLLLWSVQTGATARYRIFLQYSNLHSRVYSGRSAPWGLDGGSSLSKPSFHFGAGEVG